jgi:hypothetical protein
MSQRPETMKDLEDVYTSMDRHLQNPDSWKVLDCKTVSEQKCLCIYTLGQWKLSPSTWKRLQAWLKPFCEYGILYDVQGSSGGQLHFTLHQCSSFQKGPFPTYDPTFLEKGLKKLSGLSIVFRGLLITPTGIALRGFPLHDLELQKLMHVRNDLEHSFHTAGVPFDPPYVNDICHATLFRWTKLPPPSLIQTLQQQVSFWNESILAELFPFKWQFGYGTLTMLPEEQEILGTISVPLKIAHRGLLHGPNTLLENSVEAITSHSSNGIHSEIDIWWKDGSFWIGHDEPRERVSFEFLCLPYLWIHAKHQEAFYELQKLSYERGVHLRIFYHTDEDYVLTTHGDTIIYPGLPDVDGWIYMMPELHSSQPTLSYGVCSDYS